MNKKFADLIPPNSKIVIEFIDEDSNINDENVLGLKEKFLQINPDCQYIISNNFDLNCDKADAILFDSPSFGALSIKRLTNLINKVSDYLKNDGQMIFILDNVSYADNITALINGEAPAVKATMTLDKLLNVVSRANMTILKTFSFAKETVIKRAIAEVAKAKLNIANYAVCAMKTVEANKIDNKLIQSYLGETLVCAGIRVIDPNKFISTKPKVQIISNSSKEPLHLSEIEGKKVFINQRTSTGDRDSGIKLFNTIADSGYLYIEEMDDNPILWRQKHESSEFVDFIAAHAIQTSTKPLAEFFKQFNPNVRIFENQLKELPLHRNLAEEAAKNEPVTIFFGALNREKDLMEYLPALNRIAAEYGNNILFKIIAKTQFFDAIESKNKIFIGSKDVYNGQYVPFEVYEQTLHTSHISLLPLRDNVFNRSKSDLKFIECAGNGAVVLASPTVYSNTVKDGETGFIYHDVKEFYNKLKILINNKSKRIEMAENAYNYVKHNRLLSQHYEERWNWYNELLDKLPELNKETQKRISILKDKGASVFGGFGDIKERADVFD